jgi:hypothetical protein
VNISRTADLRAVLCEWELWGGEARDRYVYRSQLGSYNSSGAVDRPSHNGGKDRVLQPVDWQ